MKHIDLKKIPLRASPFQGWGLRVHRTIFILFLVSVILFGVRLFDPSAIFGEARWPDALLLLFATASIIGSTVLQLPAQNVMLASIIIAAIAAMAQSTGVSTGIPFGPYYYNKEFGPQLFPPLPWAVPFLWVLIVFTCRGVGRLIARPWRKTRNYGLWLMGITTGIVVLFDLGLEPFATHVKNFWRWEPSHAGLFWFRTPWVNFLGWAVTTLVILGFATPSLINKKPVKQPPDYQPLAIWLLLNSLFIASGIAHHLWLVVIVVSFEAVLVTFFAVKGARW